MRHNKHCVFFTLQSDSVGTYSFSYVGENIGDALGVSSADVLNDSGEVRVVNKPKKLKITDLMMGWETS